MTSPAPQPPVFEPVQLPSQYAKALVALATAVLGAVIVALTDNVVTTVEILNIITAFLTAVLVYVLPNVKDQAIGAWTKGIVAVAGTAVQAAIPFVAGDGMTTSGWLMVLVAALGALGVGIVPNAPAGGKVVAVAVPGELTVVTNVVNSPTSDQGGSSTNA